MNFQKLGFSAEELEGTVHKDWDAIGMCVKCGQSETGLGDKIDHCLFEVTRKINNSEILNNGRLPNAEQALEAYALLRIAVSIIPTSPEDKAPGEWLISYLQQIRVDFFGPTGVYPMLALFVERQGGEHIFSENVLKAFVKNLSIQQYITHENESLYRLRTSDPEGPTPVFTLNYSDKVGPNDEEKDEIIM